MIKVGQDAACQVVSTTVSTTRQGGDVGSTTTTTTQEPAPCKHVDSSWDDSEPPLWNVWKESSAGAVAKRITIQKEKHSFLRVLHIAYFSSLWDIANIARISTVFK